jgi:hypothetical protein
MSQLVGWVERSDTHHLSMRAARRWVSQGLNPSYRTLRALRVERKFLRRIKLICPVQTTLQKYSCSRLTQITSISIAIPFPQEGRFAVVTNVGSGMRWTRQRHARE